MRATLRIAVAACMAASGLAQAFSPESKDVCVAQSGKDQADPRRLVAKLFEEDGISDWSLDRGSGVVDHALRVRALSTPGFCAEAGRQCAPKAQEKIDAARNHMTQFLHRVETGHEKSFRAGPGAGATVAGETLVRQFLVAQDERNPVFARSVICEEQEAPATQADGADALEKIAIRGSINDLARSTTPYKALSSATFGADRNSQAGKNTYQVNGVLGYQMDRIEFGPPGNHVDAAPFVAYNLKRAVTSPPASGNVNVLSAGLLADSLFKAGFYQNVKLYPLLTKNFEDESRTVSLNLVYAPMPAIPTLGAPASIAGLFLFQARPSFNATVGDVLTDMPNTSVMAKGNFHRHGVAADLYLYGAAGSALEPVSATYNGAYYWVSGQEGFDRLKYSQVAIAYSFGPATARPTGSITLKYTTGRDPLTFQAVRDLVLGVGFKY